MKKYINYILLGLTIILSLGGSYLVSHGTLSVKGILPVFQVFQLISSPTSYGIVTTTGVATSTLTASSSVTVAGLTATSTIKLTNAADGCAQFTSGSITSTGSSCTNASTGKTIDFVAASTSSTGGSFPLASSTSISNGGSVMIWMNCVRPSAGGGAIWHLDAHTSQGTTTLGYSQKDNSGGVGTSLNIGMFGLYVATTTVNTVRFSWTDSSDNISDSSVCPTNFQFMYQRFTN